MIVEGIPETVQAAFWALGEIGQYDQMAESVLLDAVKARFCPLDALYALGKIGSPEILKTLFQEALRGESMAAILAASRIVERHMPIEATDAELTVHKNALNNLVTKHQDPAVRILAVVVTARLGLPVTIDEIEKAMEPKKE